MIKQIAFQSSKPNLSTIRIALKYFRIKKKEEAFNEHTLVDSVRTSSPSPNCHNWSSCPLKISSSLVIISPIYIHTMDSFRLVSNLTPHTFAAGLYFPSVLIHIEDKLKDPLFEGSSPGVRIVSRIMMVSCSH